jgi:hypothetical protein
VGAFPTYNISDLKAFTFQTFADIEAEDGRRLVRVLHGQISRYVKENTAPPSVKVGNGRCFPRSDLDAWIRAGGILAFKKAEGRRLVLKGSTHQVMDGRTEAKP